QPDGTTGGVVQYDLGKAKANGGWERKGSLDKPPSVLLHALASLQAEHEIGPSKVPDLLAAMLEANPGMRRPKTDFTYQGAANDRLFDSKHDHVGDSNCDRCDAAWEVERDQRESSDPEIHYGIIASGNKLIKDAATRDSLSGDTGHQCLCVEMEAAGLMDRFPCLVIRGICDYADSHKNDRWQRYAAATAAAFAVELLEYVPTAQLDATQNIAEVIQSLEQRISSLSTPIHNLDYRTAFVQLPIAEGATFDSKAEEHNPRCLHGTRQELLKEIDRWIDSSESKTIFWLNGMAGTGKSTISRTVAHSRSKRGDLGASFFFKRGEMDRGSLNKLMSTLAYQLASSIPGVAFFIKKTLDADPAIVGKSVKEQFEKLIQEPLSKAAATAAAKATAAIPSSVVMAIDALDECDQEADIRSLISILSQAKIVRPQFRVFLTSRPELPIQLGFSEVQGCYQDLVLHDIPVQIVEHDIVVFLNDEFKKIRHDFNSIVGDERKLPLDWPGHSIVQRLAQIAVPLFIFAATVCRLVGNRRCGNPSMQLRKFLDYKSKSHVSQLDPTYGPVLRSLITDVSKDDKEQIIQEFKMIVGSIVMLANPLSASALSQLLEVDPEVVNNRLDTLQSVLSIPLTQKAAVRLLHLSFRDYLLTEESEFQVDEKQTHQILAKHCLRVMRGDLRENICNLAFTGMRRSAVDREKLEKRVPSQLQYACMHWAYHQTQVDPELSNDKEVYDFLARHFLHWLEAMSLLGRVKECLDALRSLARCAETREDLSLSTFVADAERFVQAYFSVVAEAPLQIYCCVAFAPSKSIIRRTFENVIPKWISNLPKVEENWDACLLTLEGHSSLVRSVVFSHDSKWVASSSDDSTIRTWDTETGKCERELKGHSDDISSVVFSHDSKKLASGSDDNTIRIWDANTGKCEQVLEGHSGSVRSVVFSYDSKKLASGSDDNTIRIWDANTGKCEQELKGHSGWVNSVVFSHDSKWVASGSDDHTIRIWDAETGKCEQELKGHSSLVRSVVFSHDSKKLASGSDDSTIRIWDAEMGKCEQELKGHGSLVRSVAFSHDSKWVASGSYDHTIRIWDAETGECKRELKGHSGLVNLVVFSHDSKWVALGSDDHTIRIWDTETGECEQVLEGHSDYIRSMVFSHDSKKLASGSNNETIRIWDTETGKCEQELKGHSGWVNSVVFSHDSKWVASGSDDHTIRIWDAETGKCEQVLEGHSDYIRSMVFSHDSKKLASSSYDHTIRIWDAETGKCEETIPLQDYAHVLSFATDGRGIVTDRGIFALSSSSLLHAEPAMLRQSSEAPIFACTDGTWITVTGKDLLRLPPECRNGIVAEHTIEHDITAFLNSKLAEIRNNYNIYPSGGQQLPESWPSRIEIHGLAKMAIPLFIFAATACQLIQNDKHGDPEESLNKILERTGGTQISKLNELYLFVLEQLLDGPIGSGEEVLKQFRAIVGAHRIAEKRIRHMVASLPSVLYLPSEKSAPIKPLHLSFRDFLINRDKSGQFWIDEKETHKKLTIGCLEMLMNNNCLKKDICDIATPGVARSDIDKCKINEHLPSEAQYACLYWVYHLRESHERVRDGDQAHKFLELHFLHWLEALSLIGRISESIGFIDELQGMVNAEEDTQVLRFLHDAKRFALNCRWFIDTAPLQLYVSAIVFAPTQSIIRQTFERYLPEWIASLPKVVSDWSAVLQALEGHTGSVNSVVFSNDGTLVASGSHDNTIKIWNVATGKEEQTLEGHRSLVNSVVFSPDSTLIASGSSDKTIKIWNVATDSNVNSFDVS
ncbi:hypothetical protein LB504_013205, partial [Fusarium proliferatum]